MIKLIILDVDGVIVGSKPGINFPNPKQKVISALKKVRQKGIPIVLCTGKYHFAIESIIKKAQLDNPHITDSGALIFNPLSKTIIHEYTIDKQVVSNIIKICLENNIHTEVYFAKDIFLQKNQVSHILPKRIKIIQQEPIIVNSVLESAKQQNIIKLLLVVTKDEDKELVEKLLKPFSNQVTFVWTMHPSIRLWHLYLITAKGVSKAVAIAEVAKSLGLSLKDTLGVGDTLGDWEFMKLCGYKATMEDADPRLISLVGKGFIAPSVDEDGIIPILRKFCNS